MFVGVEVNRFRDCCGSESEMFGHLSVNYDTDGAKKMMPLFGENDL